MRLSLEFDPSLYRDVSIYRLCVDELLRSIDRPGCDRLRKRIAAIRTFYRTDRIDSLFDFGDFINEVMFGAPVFRSRISQDKKDWTKWYVNLPRLQIPFMLRALPEALGRITAKDMYALKFGRCLKGDGINQTMTVCLRRKNEIHRAGKRPRRSISEKSTTEDLDENNLSGSGLSL